LDEGESAEIALSKGRHAWVHVARGRAKVNGRELKTGDGAAISDEPSVRIEGIDDAEVLAFDLP
jgi:redox-sensitive bicupin YhaK (pirin superfamily)